MVSIASLHSHHHGHAHLMLMAGKHLLVAKPLTMNAAHDLIAPARDKGLFVMDAMWTLCNPLYRRLQAPVAARETGTPRAFAAQIGPMGTGSNTRILDLAQGGSFTLECLTYPLNIPAGLAPRTDPGCQRLDGARRRQRGPGHAEDRAGPGQLGGRLRASNRGHRGAASS